MPDDGKREGGGGGSSGASYASELLRVRQYPDPSRPYSTESSGSSTFTQDNRSKGHSTRDEMDDDLLLGLCSPLTRGLDWDTSFTSTVDVDAIKAPGPEVKEDTNKTPLTTIPENWESLVQDRKDHNHQESTSGSDTDSDSESGSNEATATSSSSTSVDSDTSSDDNENSKDQAFQFSRTERAKHNSGSESGKKRARRSSGYKSPNLHRTRSPNISQRTRSPHTHGGGTGRSPLRSPLSPSNRGRRRSGGGAHHRGSFHSPTSNRQGQSSSSVDAQQLNKTLHSKHDYNLATSMHESSKPNRPTKEEICARIFKVGNSSSLNSDLARTDGSSGSSSMRHNSASSEPSDKNNKSSVNRTKQIGNSSSNSNNKPLINESKNMPDLSEDSDDSCIILDNVPKPKHLQLDHSKSIFLEEPEYQHKMNALSAAYGRLSSRGGAGNSSSSQDNSSGAPRSSSAAVKLPLLLPSADVGVDLSESSDSSSVSSFSSCDLSVAEEQDIEMLSAEPSGMLSSPEECTPPPTLEPAIPSPTPHSSSHNQPSDLFQSSSNSSYSSRSPHLDIYNSQHSSKNNDYVSQSFASSNFSNSTGKKIRDSKIQSQRRARSRTKNTNFSTAGSDEEPDFYKLSKKDSNKARLATPPVLRDSADDITQNRGRPRKNPPMLKSALADADHNDQVSEDSDSDDVVDVPPISTRGESSERSHKKKDKLSIFYSVARNRKNQSTSRDYDRNSESMSQQSSEDEHRYKKSHKSERREKKGSSMQTHKQSKQHRRDNNSEHVKRKGKKHKRTTERVDTPDSAAEQESKSSRRKHKQKRERRKSGREEFFQCDSPSRESRHISSGFKKRPASSMGIARSSEPLREELPAERPASTQPQDTPRYRPDGKESPSSILKPQFLSIFTHKTGETKMVNHFASSDPNSVLVFPRKFCNLKPVKFWKKKKGKGLYEEPKATLKKSDESQETALLAVVPPPAATSTHREPSREPSSTSVFATKASVKELPSSHYQGGGTQLQQMLKALAATSSSSGAPTLGKKKKRAAGGGSKERQSEKGSKERQSSDRGSKERQHSEKGDKESVEKGDKGGEGVEVEKEKQSQEEVLSEDDESLSNRRRKRLGWKSKHKNVVDPVFLGELEHLMQDLASCQLDRKISSDIWPDRPTSCMPSIFKRRRIILSRSKRRGGDQGKISKKTKSSKATSSASGAVNALGEGVGGSPVDEEGKDEEGRLVRGEGGGEGGCSEQRLPLKKRHHHVQDSNAKDDSDMDDIEIELEIHVSPKKNSNDNKQTSLSNNREPKSLAGQDSKYSRNEGKPSATSLGSGATPSTHSLDTIKPRYGNEILSPSKLPSHRRPLPNQDFHQLHSSSLSLQHPAPSSQRQAASPHGSGYSSPRARTTLQDSHHRKVNVDTKLLDNSGSTSRRPAADTSSNNSASTAVAGGNRRPTVADRLAEKLGIPFKPESVAPLRQDSIVVGSTKTISNALDTISKEPQPHTQKDESTKLKDKTKSSRSYNKVQTSVEVGKLMVPGDAKPEHVVQLLSKQHRSSIGGGKGQQQLLQQQSQLPNNSSASGGSKRKPQDVSIPLADSLKAVVTGKETKLSFIDPSKSPRYVDPGIRSHSSQGFRSPERTRASRHCADRSRAGRAQGAWEGGSGGSSRGKHGRETSTPSSSVSHSFVESIQDCIDKYTFVDETETSPPLHSRYFTSASARSAAAASSSMKPPSMAASTLPPNLLSPSFSDKLSQSQDPSGSSADKRKEEGNRKKEEKGEVSSESAQKEEKGEGSKVEGEGSGKGVGGQMCRNSRQDLHTHLWGDDRFKKSGVCENNIPKEGTSSSLCSFTSLEKTKDIPMQMSKPLPTEPIRRVDLGFSHKPLDKSMRFHRGQECYIKKVPQAIVAPFRRNPPESSAASSSSGAVTPIHRASIGSSTASSRSNNSIISSSTAPVITTPVPAITTASLSTSVSTPCSSASPPSSSSLAATPSTSDSSVNATESNVSSSELVSQDIAAITPKLPTAARDSRIADTTPEKVSSKNDDNTTDNNIPNSRQESPRERRQAKIDLESSKKDEQKELLSLPKMKRCHVDVTRLKDSSKLLSLPKEKCQTTEASKESEVVQAVSKEIEPVQPVNANKSSIKENLQIVDKVDLEEKRPLRLRERRKTTETKEDAVKDTTETDASKKDRPRSRNKEKDSTTSRKEIPKIRLRLREDKEKSEDNQVNKQDKDDSNKTRLKDTSGSMEVDVKQDSKPVSKSSILLKVMSKKRKRRQNKTGFPTKLKKKRIKVDASDKNTEITKTKIVEQASVTNENYVKPDKNLNIIDKNFLQISISNIEVKSRRSASIKIETKVRSSKRSATTPPAEMLPIAAKKTATEVMTSKRSAAVLTENISSKRFKSDVSSTGAKESCISLPSTSDTQPIPALSIVSSSVDPSPASSDVESSDVRMSWDEESDQDTLSLLPPNEDANLTTSPSKRKRRSNIRKTYLKAGLFSFDFKTLATSNIEIETGAKMKGMVYKPEEHPFSLLPPPYYCGRQLRQKKEDFALPFDIFSLHSTGVIPSRDVLTTWNYKRIKSNIYVDIKQPNVLNYETPPCHCKPRLNRDLLGCLDDCINRMTYTECDHSCRLGSQCTNNAIQKHSSPAIVERFMTMGKGWGIRTKTVLPPGSFIMEYVGEVVTDKEFKRRMSTEYKNDNHHYCLHLGEGLVIDGHRMGGECRFVNHSCQPNCEMQKWSVNGVYRMALFSSKYLPVDTELTYDYNFSLFNPHEGQECKCNSHECRGVIGGKSQRVRLQQKSLSKNLKQLTNDKKGDKEFGKGDKKGGKADDKSSSMNEEATVFKQSLNMLSPVKPLLKSEKLFCREKSVLLCRNLDKIRKVREKYLNKVNKTKSSTVNDVKEDTVTSKSEIIEIEEPEIKPDKEEVIQKSPAVLQLNNRLKELIAEIKALTAESGDILSARLMSMSADEQKELKSASTTDLQTIEKNVTESKYLCVNDFDQDMLLVFQNFMRLYGSVDVIGQSAQAMRTKYLKISQAFYANLIKELDPELCRYQARRIEHPATEDDSEDVIICPCRQYIDEGMMIQCETCGIWQHLDCVRPGQDPETLGIYACDKCAAGGSKIAAGSSQDVQPKLDIALLPQPDYASTGEIHYASLKREDGLHLYDGMTVYVLRAFKDKNGLDDAKAKDENIFTGPGGVPHKSISPIKGPSKEAAALAPSNYPTYKTVGASASTDDMDIFRVERLWRNEAGAMFAFGYHFLRPHETFHEPSRKFFDNEVFRVPLYEVLPLDTIWRECWVLDPVTFVKGRPLAAQEEHVYICEYRVDKSARLFHKLAKGKDGICTKWFAFHTFDVKIKACRTFTPHKVPDDWVKSRPDKPAKVQVKPNKIVKSKLDNKNNNKNVEKRQKKDNKICKDRKREALNKLLGNLLEKQCDESPLDMSHLLKTNIQQVVAETESISRPIE